MTTIDKDFLRAFRIEAEQVLNDLAKRHGLSSSIGNIKFTANNFTAKVGFHKVGADGTAMTPDLSMLKMYGKNELGNNFDINSEYRSPSLGKIKFVGYVPRRYQYPFVVETINGKRYKLSRDQALKIVNS